MPGFQSYSVSVAVDVAVDVAVLVESVHVETYDPLE
jgi:hypothetical protein